MAQLEFSLFGFPKITLDGRLLVSDRRKALALLIYLACNPHPQRRDALADLFWPEFDRQSAFAYLRRTLWEINQMLGEGWLHADRDQVSLLRREQVRIDSVEFERLLAQSPAAPASLEQCIALYQADFLEGFNLRDSPGFEQWQVEQTGSLRRQFGGAVKTLSRMYAQEKRVEKAVKLIRRWLTMDNLDEEAYRQLMTCYANSGQRSLALKTYQECQKILNEELEVSPEPATTRLFEEIRHNQHGAKHFLAPAPSPTIEREEHIRSDPRSHLPVQPTRFVGRSMELLEIRRLLSDPSCRLLTLLGAGGMGKTRLALEVAQQSQPDFKQGVYFVGLSSLSSPDLILSEIARVLEIHFSETGMGGCNDQLTQLLDYLRSRRLLLLLDNFEHLLPGVELVSQILAAAPGVKVLATSRERLNLAGEWIFEIEGMSYPVGDDLRELDSYSSVQLFISTARRIQPGFQLDPGNQAAIARICRTLQGMPLGIELAAAWLRVISPAEIADELQRSLDFLGDAQHGRPERHRNLRAVFQHSWTLLAEEERQVFRNLAVFKGGFTRQAAQNVAGASLLALNALADKSLIRCKPNHRYDLHEVLHRYAMEKLGEESSAAQDVQRAHSVYYLSLLVEQQSRLSGSQVKAAHEVLNDEFDNLVQAWLTAVEALPASQLTKPFLALINYVETRSRQVECASLLNLLLPVLRRQLQAFPQDEELKTLIATALVMLGNYELIAERARQAQPSYQEALELLKNLPPSTGKAYALILCGFGAYPFSGMDLPLDAVEGNFSEVVKTLKAAGDQWGLALAYVSHADSVQVQPEKAPTLLQDILAALEIFKKLGSRWGEALCYNALSNFVNWRSNLQVARENALKTAAIYRELGDSYRLVSIQLHLGQIETALGQYEQAKIYYYDNLGVVSQLGRRYYIAIHQDSIGYLEILLGNLEQAEKLFHSSLEIYRELEHEHGIGMALSNLGDIAYRRGDLIQAESLLQQGCELQLEIKEPWGLTVCMKKLGLVAAQAGETSKAAHLWRQALGLCLQFMLVPEALEILVHTAQLDEKLGERCRALRTLRTVRGNALLSQEAAGILENQLANLTLACTQDEINKAGLPEGENDVKTWIEQGLGIKPLKIEEISL